MENNQCKIIESANDETITKILTIKFPSKIDVRSLFIPHLENIGFYIYNDSVTINLKNPTFREFFNDWIVRFAKIFDEKDTSEIMIKKFNQQIKAIVSLGLKEKKITMPIARGLFGELVAVKKLLEKNIISHEAILEGWHRPEPSNHDFDFEDYTLEIKTISRSNSTVKITSEDQLTAFENKPLNLNILRIEHLNKSTEDSLGIIYNEIKNIIHPNLKNFFELKCAEDLYCSYLGPEFMSLDYKFIILEDTTYLVDQHTFPRIKKSQLDNGISKVSYSLDLSSINQFKVL